MLSDFLFSLKDIYFLFNLFNYISFRAGLSLVSSFFFILLLMPFDKITIKFFQWTAYWIRRTHH